MADASLITRLEPSLRDRFAALAAKNNVSISAFLRAIVVDVIEEEEAADRMAVAAAENLVETGWARPDIGWDGK